MIADKDSIIVIDEEGTRHMAKAGGGILQTEFGAVDLSSVLGMEPGAKIKSDIGREFVVILEPARKICFFGRSCLDW